MVGIKDEMAGEKPKAFVVLSAEARSQLGQDADRARQKQTSIVDYMKDKTIRYKHLSGGVEFIDAIPKNPRYVKEVSDLACFDICACFRF